MQERKFTESRYHFRFKIELLCEKVAKFPIYQEGCKLLGTSGTVFDLAVIF
jgi:hypothetical protein